MIRSSRLALALVITSALTPSLAQAGSWLPLATGTRWEYRGVGGMHQVVTITGQTMVRGRAVAIMTWSEAPDAGLQNYWLLDADGGVLLAGFLDTAGSFGVAYEPPVRILPVPPTVGPTPPQPVVVHDLFTGDIILNGGFEFDVTEDVMLALPAGSFRAFGVGTLSLPSPLLGKNAACTLDGHKLPAGPATRATSSTTDWYSEDVGDVQYNTVDLYQLIGFGQPTTIAPTAVATSSWGAIKRLYR